MKGFVKVICIVLFALVFLLTLIAATLRFEVLSSSFVFGSFQRNGVYEKLPGQFAKALPNDPNLGREEGAEIGQSVSSITPAAAKIVIEKNLSNVLGFLNGKEKDINISVSPADLGMTQGMTLSWSTKDSPKEQTGFINLFFGIGNKLLITFIVLLGLLFLLYKVVGKITFLISGILSASLGGAGWLFLHVLATNTPAKEPSQVLLLLLSSSVLSDIVLSWIFIGILLIAVWIFLRKTRRFSKT